MIKTNCLNNNDMQILVPYDMALFDKKITAFFYTKMEKQFVQRLSAAAAFFLGKPYVWEPLGEGPNGKYDQKPLYQTDCFDCVNYVNTILALSKSFDLEQFKQNILRARYTDQQINYLNRTDWFTDLEWLPNIQKNGWLQDVTLQMTNEEKSIATAVTIIDKPNWYKVRPMKAIHLLKPITKDKATQLLMQLREEGAAFQPIPSQLTYLPLTELFDEHGNPNAFLFDQIPSAAVVVIVRPNWQIRDRFEGFPDGYGTNLNVSHLGIAIRIERGLMFYHASSMEKKVVCLPLTDYLQHYLHHETIKGIHIEKIL